MNLEAINRLECDSALAQALWDARGVKYDELQRFSRSAIGPAPGTSEAERARSGGVYLGALDRATLRRLKQQLMAPAWELDAQGRRKVEPKDDTKEKIGRSPDDADAFLLAYFEAPTFLVPTVIEPGWREESRGGPFGRGMEGWRYRGR